MRQVGTEEYVDLVFPVPGEYLSTNEANRLHWSIRRRRLAPWRDAVGWAWKLEPVAQRSKVVGTPCRIQVSFGFKVARRRDPSNYVGTLIKAMVDTLVELQVWPDDTPEWVAVDEPELVVGEETVRVRLVVR